MSSHEKTIFGATVEPVSEPTPSAMESFTLPDAIDTSTQLTPSRSPSPPAAAVAIHSITKKPYLSVYETDLEAGSTLTRSTSHLSQTLEPPSYPTYNVSSFASSAVSINTYTKECTMWPSKATLTEKARADKARRCSAKAVRGCGPVYRAWVGLSWTQRTWCKVLFALAVVALAVGLGVGITRAVDGGFWFSDGQ